MSKSLGGRLAVLLAVFGMLTAGVVAAINVQAADHLEAPTAAADGRLDITDLYAFQSPESADSTVIVMAVNPLAGVNGGTTFKSRSKYEVLIDDGSAKPTKVRVRFNKPKPNGKQVMKVFIDGEKVAKGRTGTTHNLPGGISATAGLYDDPFFFDLAAFNDQVKAAGGDRTFCDGSEADFLAGTNVNAIVFEIPNDTFASSNLAIWARTGSGGVIDRVGRPAIATVLIPDGSEDDFNKTKPKKDLAKWGSDVKATLLALSGLDGTPYSDAEAQGITEFLLPDVLTIDTSMPTGFPNGRGLADDVIDAELGIVTGGFFGGSPVLTSDCVPENDKPFRTSFPYLAKAHK